MSTNIQATALPVALNDWQITAKLDFITLEMPAAKRNCLRTALIKEECESELIKLPKRKRSLITVHDPSTTDLQVMLDFDHNSRIDTIEFTLDFRPIGTGPAGDDELAPMFRWISDYLFPGMHNEESFVPGWGKARQIICDDHGRYVKANGICPSLRTRRWENRNQYIKNRLYLKRFDQRTEVERPSVRLELTLNRGGCQKLNIEYLWNLLDFAPNLRRELSKYFSLARGGKPKQWKRPDRYKDAHVLNQQQLERVELAWRSGGAMALVNEGYEAIPDTAANERVGKALDRLRSSLMKLKMPQKSPAPSFDYSSGNRMNPASDDIPSHLSIGTGTGTNG